MSLKFTYAFEQFGIKRRHQIAGTKEIDTLQIDQVVKHFVFIKEDSQHVFICNGNPGPQDFSQAFMDCNTQWQWKTGHIAYP